MSQASVLEPLLLGTSRATEPPHWAGLARRQRRLRTRAEAMFKAAIVYYCNFYTSRSGIKNNGIDGYVSDRRKDNGLGIRLCVLKQ